MATATYDLLDSTTLSSAASSVSFTSIDQSYRDLVLVVSGNSTDTSYLLRLNNRSGSSDYPYVDMLNFGSSVFSNSGSRSSVETQISSSSTVTDVSIHQILDYSATDKHKSVLSAVTYNAGPQVVRIASRFAYTEAVTRLDMIGVGNFNAGSTFYLYGIAS